MITRGLVATLGSQLLQQRDVPQVTRDVPQWRGMCRKSSVHLGAPCFGDASQRIHLGAPCLGDAS